MSTTSRPAGSGPGIPRPADTTPAGPWAADPLPTEKARAVPGRKHRRSSKHRALRRALPPWLHRRAWLLVIAILAGSCAGLVYSATATPSYTAQVTLAVPAGATPNSPGSANDANALALSYATILAQNDAILAPAAAQLGVPLNTLTNHLSLSVENGTSVLLLSYTAPTQDAAIRAVNTVATHIVNDNRSSSVVPAHTVYAVQLANSARSSNVVAKYGPELGFIVGALIGAILVLMAERVDPRADQPGDVDEVFGRPTVVAVPSELSIPEFGHAIVNASGPNCAVTLAPLRWWDVPAARSIEKVLGDTYPEASLSVSAALEEGMAHQLDSRTTLVLVIRSGERMRTLGDLLERLHLMGNSPDWIALLDRDDIYD